MFVMSEPFVNRALFRLLVIACNTTTEQLVHSTVTLNGDTRAPALPVMERI